MTSTTQQRVGGSSHESDSSSNLMSGVSRLAEAAANQFPTLAEQVEVLKRDVAKLASQAGVTAKHQVEPLERFIEREPMKAVLLAAGIGSVLTFLLCRR